jgi:hypothetical protein
MGDCRQGCAYLRRIAHLCQQFSHRFFSEKSDLDSMLFANSAQLGMKF